LRILHFIIVFVCSAVKYFRYPYLQSISVLSDNQILNEEQPVGNKHAQLLWQQMHRTNQK